jgi:hypothetical protein
MIHGRLNMEQLMNLELAKKTEVLGENLPHCHFVHHKSNMKLITPLWEIMC